MIRRLLAACALIVVAVVVAAVPADAHAVLLRTTPTAQSTVPTSPAEVRLSFSESVDVTFGGIRLYDVDGHRVDAGEATREGDDVALRTPRLSNGSYTVTWSVTSADGHALHGGFVFYVGAPSAISPVRVAPDAGAGRVVGLAYGITRFLWYAGLFALVGLVVFRRWVWSAARPAAETADPEDVGRARFARGLVAAWALLLATIVATLVFESATRSGRSLLSAARPATLGAVLGTDFGPLWIGQGAATLALLLPVVALARRGGLGDVPVRVWVGISGLLVLLLAVLHVATGHARTDPRPALAIASAAIHLLAAAVWVGGLAAFVVVGLPAATRLGADRRRVLAVAVRRFGGIAMGAVAVVVLTGSLNSLQDLGAPSDLWRVPYGRTISAKILLLALALGLAARHQFVTRRRLASGDPDGGFATTARAEAVVLAVVVAIAAGLVVMVPGRSIALRARGPLNAEHRAGDYTVQAVVDPTALGRNEVHLTYVDRNGLASAAVSNTTAHLAAPSGTDLQLKMRLISPGHFVGEVELTDPGRYRLVTSGRDPRTTVEATFTFTIREAS